MSWVGPEIVEMLNARMSPAVTVVVVKSEVVELRTCVPLESDTPLVEMLFDTVGTAVPDATFHVVTVAVPVSALIDHPVIVHAYGAVK